MNDRPKSFYPLIIVGAGIAGTLAARCVLDTGIKAALISSGSFFSGSSFYPGTWGFGLIGPKDDHDINDLSQSIEAVGQHTNYPRLSKHFVSSILPSIEELERFGVKLQKPSKEAQTQKEFIPCFDSRQRTWRGITQAAYRFALEEPLKDGKIDCFEYHELIDIIVDNNQVKGLLVFDSRKGRIIRLECSAVILATGGFSGLFKRSLGSKLADGVAQGIMLSKGALCTNLEFMQIMQGYCKPKSGIVFNEKIYKNISLCSKAGEDILELYQQNHAQDPTNKTYASKDLLEARSEHGPFTCERASSLVDRAISSYADEGVYAHFTANEEAPEFVETYFKWLENTRGISRHDSIELAPYAHAANGGILINELAQTSIKGIFAAGEVSGGMHGADRIGGLASANALVFGLIAAKQAVSYCIEHSNTNEVSQAQEANENATYKLAYSPYFAKHLELLKDLMSKSFMLERNEVQLNQALNSLQEMLKTYTYKTIKGCDTNKEIAHAQKTYAQLISAYALCYSARMRQESRGSHDRSDYASHNTSLACPQVVRVARMENPHITMECAFDREYSYLDLIKW